MRTLPEVFRGYIQVCTLICPMPHKPFLNSSSSSADQFEGSLYKRLSIYASQRGVSLVTLTLTRVGRNRKAVWFTIRFLPFKVSGYRKDKSKRAEFVGSENLQPSQRRIVSYFIQQVDSRSHS